MKRHLLIILAFLAAAFAGSILLALGCSIFGPVLSSGKTTVHTGLAGANQYQRPPGGVPAGESGRWTQDDILFDRCLGCEWTVTNSTIGQAEHDTWKTDYGVPRCAAGWPLRAFDDRATRGRRPDIPSAWHPSFPMVPLSSKLAATWTGPGAATRHIPLTPIWPGLLADTAFYAGLLWLTLIAPRRLRARRRRRRGRCVACGYDLAGIAGACPECGGERA